MGFAQIKEVEEYWNRRPCNIRHSNEEVGTRKYFDEVEERKYFVEPHIPEFAEFARWRGKTILEVGCGIGTDAINFVRAGAKYTGLELSSKSMELTQKRFEVYGFNGELILGNIEENLPALKNRKFDLVYSFGVLHHTPNIVTALDSIRNHMHEESTLKIMVYARNSWKQAMIYAGMDQPEAQNGCPIANSYQKDEIVGILENLEFQTLSVRQTHIFPYVVEKYRAYEYEKVPWFGAMPEEIFKKVENVLGWHLLIEAKLSRNT